MKTLQEINQIVGRVKYKDWRFIVSALGYAGISPDQLYLQVEFDAPDNVTGADTVQHGRKWLISRHMTDSEIVTTALKAVLSAEEHEAREQFLYRDAAIFGPHFNVDALHSLLEVAGDDALDIRAAPITSDGQLGRRFTDAELREAGYAGLVIAEPVAQGDGHP